MRNFLPKFFFLIAILFTNFVAFAQETAPPPPPPYTTNGVPGGGNDTGDLEGDDLPIDGKLIWLAVCGIAFSFYTYNKTTKSEVSQ